MSDISLRILLTTIQIASAAINSCEESAIGNCHCVSNITVNIPQCDCNRDSYEEALKENQELRTELKVLKESVVNCNDSDGTFVLVTLAWYQM